MILGWGRSGRARSSASLVLSSEEPLQQAMLLAFGREAIELCVDRAHLAHQAFELLAGLCEEPFQVLGCYGI